MSNTPLIEAVKENELAKVAQLLDDGHDVNEKGNEQQWPALNFAAGKGRLEMISLLLQRGANVFGVGIDNRTPYSIALAAGQIEACKILRDAEEAVGGDRDFVSSRAYQKRPYCKAYSLGDLRKFNDWRETWTSPKQDGAGEPEDEVTDSTIVFIHQDYTVTKSMWCGEDVIYDAVTEAWREFCDEELKFKIPHDFDLVPVGASKDE